MLTRAKILLQGYQHGFHKALLPLAPWQKQLFYCPRQGSLTEGEGSVQLTSVY
jgi:hypothetical protein